MIIDTPFVKAWMFPEESTEATEGLEEVQVTAAPFGPSAESVRFSPVAR